MSITVRLVSLFHLILLLLFTCSSSGASSTKDNRLPIWSGPDRFVAAAPCMAAAVCRDGVALVALHTSDEPLLWNDSSQHHLPANFRGPRRIERVDPYGTALMCAGWRADGHGLLTKCRALAANERNQFGDFRGRSCDYGRLLARELSLWMAHCVVSDRLRALSCVGLLAVCENGGNGNAAESYLWLVDPTGAYRVYAHAVGGGDGHQFSDGKQSSNSKYNKEEIGLAASAVNEKLVDIDFTGMSKEDGVDRLCQILLQVTNQDTACPHIKVEAAVLDPVHQRLQHVRPPFVTKETKTKRTR